MENTLNISPLGGKWIKKKRFQLAVKFFHIIYSADIDFFHSEINDLITFRKRPFKFNFLARRLFSTSRANGTLIIENDCRMENYRRKFSLTRAIRNESSTLIAFNLSGWDLFRSICCWCRRKRWRNSFAVGKFSNFPRERWTSPRG